MIFKKFLKLILIPNLIKILPTTYAVTEKSSVTTRDNPKLPIRLTESKLSSENSINKQKMLITQILLLTAKEEIVS